MRPRGWAPLATGPGWWLHVRVWVTGLDLRVRTGRRAGRLSYAFPVVLVGSVAAMWLAGVR